MELTHNCLSDVQLSMRSSRVANFYNYMEQIETTSRKADKPNTTIRLEDIFKTLPGIDEPIRTVLTKGVAGIGKTVLTQKFTLDWAEEKSNQDIQFIFPFTFKELNVLKEEKFSLLELVHHFFTETKEAGICSFEDFQVLFIFDGLDECRLPLDFHKTKILTDSRKSTSVDVLLTNLIRGNLLSSAHIWITTRPAAANQIPPECVDMVTEVRGFTDPQKEEYFRKRFRDKKQASRIISHIKTSQSLHIMCHIPVFCWINATVLEDVLKTKEQRDMPKTLTELYIHFLVVQAKVKKVKYDGGSETDPHWMYSGVFTQIFKEERGLYQDKVFCFVHLTFNKLKLQNCGGQFLHKSAVDKALESPNGHLDLFLRFLLGLSLQSNQALLRGLLTQTGMSSETNQQTVQYIKKKISENLSVEQSINLFHCLNELHDRALVGELQQSLSMGSLSTEKLSPAQWSALVFILLTSEKDLDVLDLKKYSASEDALLRLLPVLKASKKALKIKTEFAAFCVFSLRLNNCNLTERSCEALSLSLKVEGCELRTLDLSNNNLQDSGVNLLIAGMESMHCKLEKLRSDTLFVKSCGTMSSVLSLQFSSLREMDLSNNNLRDTGVKALSDGLRSPHCKLETLRSEIINCLFVLYFFVLIICCSLIVSVMIIMCRLSGCLITEEGCTLLASDLRSNPSCLRELDLSYNHPGETGMNLLKQLRLDNLRYRERLIASHTFEHR
uniref:NACHT domain-containing protein n=1 Tax=Astatotilapia calliptera TaxID=8154 RepID=A0AAX7VBA7_ASTCA